MRETTPGSGLVKVKLQYALDFRSRVDDPLTVRPEYSDVMFFCYCNAFFFNGRSNRSDLRKSAAIENDKFNTLLTAFLDHRRHRGSGNGQMDDINIRGNIKNRFVCFYSADLIYLGIDRVDLSCEPEIDEVPDDPITNIEFLCRSSYNCYCLWSE